MATRPGYGIHTLLVGLAGVAMVAAAGCSGGGGGHPTATVPLTAAAATTTTTAPPPGQQALQAMVVQPGDLTAGWTATPVNASTTSRAGDIAFAQCVGAQDTSSDAVATGFGPTYVKGGTEIASTATSFRSTADVQADTAALANPKAGPCLVQVERALLAATLPKKSTIKSLTLKVTPGPGAGPAAVIATASGTVAYTTAGHTVTIHSDTVFLSGPRVEANIEFYSSGTPVSAQVQALVVNKVALRVAASS